MLLIITILLAVLGFLGVLFPEKPAKLFARKDEPVPEMGIRIVRFIAVIFVIIAISIFWQAK